MSSKLKALLYDEAKATQCLKIASTAITCDRDARINRARIVATVEGIVEKYPDVELVIFGEMVLGWYTPGQSPEYDEQISEPIPGDTTRKLASLAQKYRIYICFGISELDGGALYNSQVLLNPDGEIQVVHRKKNLKPGEIAANYQPGSAKVTSTDIKGIRAGIVICADTASPQTMWALMRGKFDLIIHSLADDDQDDFVTKFQARMYDAWFVTANRFGKEDAHDWPGLITVTDPLGRIRSTKVGQEQVLIFGLRLADRGSWLKQLIRIIWVRVPVVFHVAKNWKQAKSYL